MPEDEPHPHVIAGSNRVCRFVYEHLWNAEVLSNIPREGRRK